MNPILVAILVPILVAILVPIRLRETSVGAMGAMRARSRHHSTSRVV